MSGVPFPVGLFTLLANHHGISQPSATVLEACFLLMAPFRTRFSPCEMARTANVQRLIRCLYTLWYCYILTCRFHGTARPRPSATDSSHTGRHERARLRCSDPTRPAGAPRPHDRWPAGL